MSKTVATPTTAKIDHYVRAITTMLDDHPGSRLAVWRILALGNDQRREPSVVTRGQHSLIGTALGNVSANRAHRHADRVVRFPAAHGVLDPLRRDCLPRVIHGTCIEVTVKHLATQHVRESLQRCSVFQCVAIRVVLKPTRDERARLGIDKFAINQDRIRAINPYRFTAAIDRPANLAGLGRILEANVEPRRKPDFVPRTIS